MTSSASQLHASEAALAELTRGLSEQEVALLVDTCRPFLWTGAISGLQHAINHEPAAVWGAQWQLHYPGLAGWVGRFSSSHAEALLAAAERFWCAGGLSTSHSLGDALRAIGLLEPREYRP